MGITAGTVIFISGVLLLIAGIVMLAVFLAAAPSSKRKIRDRMKEKY